MKYTAIVLAGGSGSRMQSGTPKQLMSVLGRPLLYYSLAAFEKSPVTNIVLVTPAGEEGTYLSEFRGYGISKIVCAAAGGAERCDSVYSALQAIRENHIPSDFVLIHDGARACVTQKIITDMMEAAEAYGAAVAAVPTKDTVKIAGSDGFVGATPDRSIVWNVQTPQAFATDLVCAAFDAMYEKTDGSSPRGITDDSMVVERYGGTKVKLVEAAYTNIKVTTPEDLPLCEEILRQQGWT